MSDFCILCKAPLKYLDSPKVMRCEICGKSFEGHAVCENGHYVCDACHASPAEGVVRSVVLNSSSKDPVDIADEIMASSFVHMHGPEHHFIVGASLLCAYSNTYGGVDLENALNAVISRGKKVPGGFCGMAGCCGAAVSAGIFLSVILKATPMSKEEWALSNRMTSRCLEAVSRLGGPRCCKRDSYTTILAAAEFLREELGKPLGVSDEILCSHFGDNAECLKVECPYFPRT
ncbi:MAG: SAM-dependent methyltransferase [Methanocorpusculum parvum]|nr:SAM-dependent methyltransferase [Methanocorpusculum parvum]